MIGKCTGFDVQLKWKLPKPGRLPFVSVTLFLFLITIYGNSFHCDWHFDDFHNIVNNTNVHLRSLTLQEVLKSFHGYIPETDTLPINRPFAYFTFAINHLLNGKAVFGYHVVNFTIHYFASFFLFLLIYNMLRLPVLQGRYETSAYSIALLSSFFWATHPIHVSAVTYIVQRMASMAGMLYIMSLYFFLKARTAALPSNRYLFWGLCLLSGLLSFGSKENAVMLPVCLGLFELYLIKGAATVSVRKTLGILVMISALIMVAVLAFKGISFITDGYRDRPFTLMERLITQPRVFLFYISLLFYPVNSRLTLLHDIEKSTGLLTPWTTLPAIGIVLTLIGVAILMRRKSPLVSFCVLFFFINQLVEGSIIPIELVFEHRNYLPSIFLFVPVAIVWLSVVEYFSYNRALQLLMVFGLTVLLMTQAHTVAMRNDIFQNGITLWQDNVKKAPDISRPHHNLGKNYIEIGLEEEGVNEMLIAVDKKALARKTQKAETHFNLGMVYIHWGDYDEALKQFERARNYTPNHPKVLGKMAVALLYRGDLELAETYARKGLKYAKKSAELHHALGLILLKKGNTEDAIKEAIASLSLPGDNDKSFFIIGEAYRQKSELKKSVLYFRRFFNRYPKQVAVSAALIELFYLLEQEEALEKQINHLLSLTGSENLAGALEKYDRTYNSIDSARIKRIGCAIKLKLSHQMDEIIEQGCNKPPTIHP